MRIDCTSRLCVSDGGSIVSISSKSSTSIDPLLVLSPVHSRGSWSFSDVHDIRLIVLGGLVIGIMILEELLYVGILAYLFHPSSRNQRQ